MKNKILSSVIVALALVQFGCVKAEKRQVPQSSEEVLIGAETTDRIALLRATMNDTAEDRQYLESLLIQRDEEESLDENELAAVEAE